MTDKSGELAKDYILNFRETKGYVQAFNPFVKGTRGSVIDRRMEEANLLAAQLQDRYHELIEGRFDKFKDYFGTEVSRGDVEETFFRGFANFLTAEHRMQKKEGGRTQAQLDDSQYIEQSLKAYFFDFNRSLNISQRLGFTPRQALELARLTYRQNPNILIKLTTQYPNLDLYIIKHAVESYSSDPGKFIEDTLAEIARLSVKYPDTDRQIIKRAAVHNSSNPDAFIDKANRAIERLETKYPDADPFVVKTAAVLYPSAPDTFVEETLSRIKDLTSQYPDVEAHIIKIAAVSYPSDPGKFVEETLERIKRLKSRYPRFARRYYIREAATNYPNKPEEYIEKPGRFQSRYGLRPTVNTGKKK